MSSGLSLLDQFGTSAGTIGLGEAEPGRLGQPPLQAADPAQLAGQPDLADRDQPGMRRRVSHADDATAIATARSADGSLTFAPPTVET